MTIRQLTTTSGYHIQTDADIKWGEVLYQTESDVWVVNLEIGQFPHGRHTLTFFGTEEQIRAIAGGPVPEVTK